MNLREWALPVYTILMQFSVGTLTALWVLRVFGMRELPSETIERILRKPILVLVFSILTAIIGSHFHLSKPYFSFLAVLNFGTSWLSREIVFTILLLVSCLLLTYLIWFVRGHNRFKILLGWFAVACGWIVIYCMASLYLLPTQPIWDTPITILLFFGSALLLGAAVAGALLIMDTVFSEAQESDLAGVRKQLIRRSAIWFGLVAVLVVALISLLNGLQINSLRDGTTPELTSLNLLTGVYGPLLIARFVSMFFGVIMLAVTMLLIHWRRKALADLVVPVHLACLLMVVGEILGRFLFYATHVRIGV
jgi:anaerobic dimethyl sulfoxide reductase subunit C (anchor subunit)